MDPTSTSVDGLAAVETRNHQIGSSRKRGIAAQDAAQMAGQLPMDRGTLPNTPALKLALTNAFVASLGLPELTAHG